jgi:hypothetical protein
MLRLLAVVTLTVAFGCPSFAETAAQKRVKVTPTPVLPRNPKNPVEPKEKPKDFRLKVSGSSKS